MTNNKGITFANDIFDAIPISAGGISMKRSKLEDEIIPANPNMVKKQRKKRIKKEVVNTNSQKVEVYAFSGDVDPFKDAPNFMRYYRSFLGQLIQNNGIVFEPFNVDSIYATQVLDLLHINGRSNKVFLNSWLRYFYEYKLKGEKALKTKYTNLNAFKATFKEYNDRHMEV